jgi:hypothetical protein
MELAKRIDDVLTTLYDYEYINLERFYNDKENTKLLETLDKVINTGDYSRQEQDEINDLYENLNDFIKFETNYNADIGMF